MYSWLLLIPIIGIEAYVLRKRLVVSMVRAVSVSGLANFASTMLGTVVVMAVDISFAVVGLRLFSGGMLDIGVLIALIPCFYLSVWFESLHGTYFLDGFSKAEIWGVFFQANKFSYALLGIVAIGSFIKNAIIHGRIIW